MIRRSSAILVAAAILGTGLITGCDSRTNSAGSTDAAAVTEQTTVQSAVQSTAQSEAAATEPTETTQAKLHYYITEEITSGSIADNNAMGDPGTEKIFIYLPPDYYDSEESYPVVYYLHGFGETPGSFLMSSKLRLNNLFSEGDKSFIMVEVSGSGFTGGSFYVNSPASGNWEDCLIDEVIPYVDAGYRTLPKAESRGICGFSMGGFGAMNLALLHPDVFGAVYAMSPGIMKDDALAEAMKTWTGDAAFQQAYARAFAPDLEGSTFFGDIPALDGSEEDNAICAKWYSGFGNWSQKLDAYLALGTPLRAIGISYGTNDGYTWIPTGSAYFADLLRENGIDPVEFSFEGGHEMPENTIKDHLGPFFLENLSWG
jgi:S-formylglutathione hydrolase FrmB